jgi:3-oxoacyl-[acyl-carrier protein] reductase
LFAQEGARLCLNDKADGPLRRLADELTGAGAEAVAVPGDISEPVTASQLVKTCLDEFGSLDVLVNNAGVIKYGPVTEFSVDDWHSTMATDLTAAFLCTRAALPPMIEQGSGRIINISSQLALRGAAGFAAYCAAKAGLIGFSKAVAREVAGRGITVNCVAPGPIDTAMLDVDGNSWTDADRDRLPLGRIGRPDEVAPSVLFLACDPEGNLFTGQTLGPNSGDVMY